MRILSLLPAATDIVRLLGLEEDLVGTEKDFPSEITNKLSSNDINYEISSMIHKGRSIYHIDREKLKELSPNLILTQEICKVCAISSSQIEKAARILRDDAQIVSLEPESVEDILGNILTVGKYAGRLAKAKKLVGGLRTRLALLSSRLAAIRLNGKRPKVLIIEWLEPLMVAGHWVPEMVEKAGGKMLLTKPRDRSRVIESSDFKELNPDIVIVAPCGFDISRTFRERDLIENLKLKVENSRLYLVDGDKYLTRPGPKIIDGIEILSEILCPEIFERKHTLQDWQKFP